MIDRICRSCGKVFSPRTANQRRCAECIRRETLERRARVAIRGLSPSRRERLAEILSKVVT